MFNDSYYFTKKTVHTNKITNNITRHNHNNFEHNVIKKLINILSILIIMILK